MCLNIIPACDLPVKQTRRMLLIKGKLHTIFFLKHWTATNLKVIFWKLPHIREGRTRQSGNPQLRLPRHMTWVWSWCSPHSTLLPTAGCTRQCRSSCTQELLQQQSNFLSHDFGFSGLFSFLNHFHPSNAVKLLIHTVLQKLPLL